MKESTKEQIISVFIGQPKQYADVEIADGMWLPSKHGEHHVEVISNLQAYDYELTHRTKVVAVLGAGTANDVGALLANKNIPLKQLRVTEQPHFIAVTDRNIQRLQQKIERQVSVKTSSRDWLDIGSNLDLILTNPYLRRIGNHGIPDGAAPEYFAIRTVKESWDRLNADGGLLISVTSSFPWRHVMKMMQERGFLTTAISKRKLSYQSFEDTESVILLGRKKNNS